MRIVRAFGLLTGATAAVVLICALVLFLERRFPGKNYDERQKTARGRAYRVSFCLGLAYDVVVMEILLFQEAGQTVVSGYLLLFAGFMLKNLIFHVYSLLCDAALPLGNKPATAIAGYGITACICLFYVCRNTQLLALSGEKSTGWIFLLTGFFSLTLALLHLISALRRQKE